MDHLDRVSPSAQKILEMECEVASLEVVANKFTEQLLELQSQRTDRELEIMKHKQYANFDFQDKTTQDSGFRIQDSVFDSFAASSNF